MKWISESALLIGAIAPMGLLLWGPYARYGPRVQRDAETLLLELVELCSLLDFIVVDVWRGDKDASEELGDKSGGVGLQMAVALTLPNTEPAYEYDST